METKPSFRDLNLLVFNARCPRFLQMTWFSSSRVKEFRLTGRFPTFRSVAAPCERSGHPFDLLERVCVIASAEQLADSCFVEMNGCADLRVG
jgi:hypothetical protein